MKIHMVSAASAFVVMLGMPIVGLAQTEPAPMPTLAPVSASSPAAMSTPLHKHGGFMRAVRSTGLSAQQRLQIKGLVSQYRQAHPKGSPPDHAAHRALHQAILNVLTPDQQAQVHAALPPRK